MRFSRLSKRSRFKNRRRRAQTLKEKNLSSGSLTKRIGFWPPDDSSSAPVKRKSRLCLVLSRSREEMILLWTKKKNQFIMGHRRRQKEFNNMFNLDNSWLDKRVADCLLLSYCKHLPSSSHLFQMKYKTYRKQSSWLLRPSKFKAIVILVI